MRLHSVGRRKTKPKNAKKWRRAPRDGWRNLNSINFFAHYRRLGCAKWRPQKKKGGRSEASIFFPRKIDKKKQKKAKQKPLFPRATSESSVGDNANVNGALDDPVKLGKILSKSGKNQ